MKRLKVRLSRPLINGRADVIDRCESEEVKDIGAPLSQPSNGLISILKVFAGVACRARQRIELSRCISLKFIQMKIILLTSNYNAGRVTDLTLSVSRDARVIPDVLVLDRRDPELGAVVEYPDGRRRLDRVRVFVPEDFRRRCTLRLAVQYYRVAHVHVDHVLRCYAEFWRGCENRSIIFIPSRGPARLRA